MKQDAKELLRPYLLGERAGETGEWDMYCPLHDDRRRSAQINFDEGVWYCHAEDAGGSIDDLIRRREEWVPRQAGDSSSGAVKRAKGRKQELPSEAEVAGWRAALMSDPVALEDLKSSRDLWTATIDHYEIGWDRGKTAYTIPIRNRQGTIINIRYYNMRPGPKQSKMWGVTGHTKPSLFPLAQLKQANGEVVICEGELDAIVTNQNGFPALTRTASAATWKPAWNASFKDLIVYVCHDADTAGQKANQKVAHALQGTAKEVRILKLPYPVAEKNGRDLTDWWLDHDDPSDFRRLLDEAIPYEDADDVDEAAVNDAFDSRKVGKALALTLTIKGRREPGYTVPRQVRYNCSQDKGPICEICPMKAEDGQQERLITGSDPVILELIESTKPQVLTVLRSMARIPKCEKLKIEVKESQAVEVLYAQPSIEHALNGNVHNEYKNIKLTSVGRHDTSPNQTVRVVGALHPDPRHQMNEFLTWDLTRLETSLDRFEVDEDSYKLMREFQPAPGQSPLRKLRDIVDDLATHVTLIYDRPEMHAAMDLTFHSAISFDFGGQRLARGWLELLVVGDTRTGKSEAATRMTQFYDVGEVVSCESASLAGILGGLQQFGSNKDWAITWGAIPINDRRLVVLDEISGLEPEEISHLSSVRSSGIAELTKIQQERTHARTRMIWMGNPRNGRMSDYTYGVQALRPLIGNAEDVARFDLAMSVSSADVTSDSINRSHTATPQRYGQEATSLLLRWVWSRTPEQVTWEAGAEAAVFKAAQALGQRYIEDPPLIQAANVRVKVARLAVAIAGRLFSTDERAENIIVRSSHVRAAVQFIDRLYQMRGFGYAERSQEVLRDARASERPENKATTRALLDRNVGLDKFLRGVGQFRRQDLEEILDIDREEANAIISELYQLRMIWKDRGDTRLSPTLHQLLREDTK